MKITKKRFLLIFTSLILSFSLLAGCHSADTVRNNQQNTVDSASSENENFREFTDAIFRDNVSGDIISLHTILQHPENYGITNYEKTLGRYNLDNPTDSSDISDCLTQLNSFDKNSLSKDQQITYELLKKYLETKLEYCDLFLLDTDLSTTIGIQVQLPIIFAEYTFNEVKDIDEYLCAVEDTDEFFENLIEYEKMRSEKGYFMETSLAEEIIEQCNTFIDSADDGYLITTFEEKLNNLPELDETQKSSYQERNKAAVNEHVIKGYRILADGIEQLKNTGKYSGGLCNYPNGQKYYEYLVNNQIGWSKTIDEYDALLDSYISRNIASIQGLYRKNLGLSDQFNTFHFQYTQPMEILSDLKEKIKTSFPEGADVNYEVKYITKALQDYASPAMYFTPQIDNNAVNSIYINPKSTGSSDIYTTLAHEGFPGHLYQITYFANKNSDLIRHIIQPGGYIEGWATYCEALSYQYADTDNAPLNTLMQLNYSTIMLIYGKVDIGVNYYGWSEDDVYNFISSYGFNDKSVATQMYSQMLSEPANYCKYVLGYVGFMELKAAAMQKQGNSFNLKEFHKYILDMGPVQFDILFENLPE